MESKTKYNLERSYINGGNVVDPINQATFQNPLYVDGYPEIINLDLSLSNFFIVDLEDGNTDYSNPRNAILNPINLGRLQRFEVLFIEPFGLRNFISGDNNFQFPNFYDDPNFGNMFSMEIGLRREMLITFKITHPTFNHCLNNTQPIFLGDVTPWFDSELLNINIEFVIRDQFGNLLDNVTIILFHAGYDSLTEITSFGRCSFIRPRGYYYIYYGSFGSIFFMGELFPSETNQEYLKVERIITI